MRHGPQAAKACFSSCQDRWCSWRQITHARRREQRSPPATARPQSFMPGRNYPKRATRGRAGHPSAGCLAPQRARGRAFPKVLTASSTRDHDAGDLGVIRQGEVSCALRVRRVDGGENSVGLRRSGQAARSSCGPEPTDRLCADRTADLFGSEEVLPGPRRASGEGSDLRPTEGPARRWPVSIAECAANVANH